MGKQRTKIQQYNLIHGYIHILINQEVGNIPPLDPYIIYGTITIDEVLQNNILITIENITNGGNGTINSNINGQYIYDDLAQLSLGYSNGDTIKVSVSENSVLFTAGLPEIKLINFTIYNHSITLNGISSISELESITLNLTISLNGISSITETNIANILNDITLNGTSSIIITHTMCDYTSNNTFANWLKQNLIWENLKTKY